MAYTRPGVFVTENTLLNTPIRNSAAAVAAFIGTSTRGPETPTYVDSWAGYKSLFGELDQSHDLGFALYHYFANGGRVAYVTRVNGSGASVGTSQSITYTPSTGASATAFMTLQSKNTGSWANNLSVVVSAGRVTATATKIPTFNLSVLLSGTEVEAWSELSSDPASSRYAPTLLSQSSALVEVVSIASVTAAVGFEHTDGTYTFSGGGDGAAVGSSEYQDALTLLNDVEGSLIINCVGRSDTATVTAALSYAEGRGDSFVIIDPNSSLTTSSTVAAAVDAYGTSGYGAVYYPMVTMVDPSKSGPSAIRATYPGGALAGIYVRTDAERSVAKTPAGYAVDVRNALGLELTINDAFIDATFDSGVNCLKVVPGAGVVVLGGRTLEPVQGDRYIAVRRALNYVKRGVADIARDYLFEMNESTMWSDLESRIRNFLLTFWGVGGLKGASSEQAFYVVCDSTNNTETTIDNGELHIEVGVALQYPAEFIVINVNQWTGGSVATENL